MTTVVLLISEQTLPNVLFVKELLARGISCDAFVFISTQKMEAQKRSNWLAKCLEIAPTKISKWLVEAESFPAAAQVITEELAKQPADNSYYINLTGGTKMMAMAAFQCLVEMPRVNAYYMPLGGEKLQQIYPNNEETPLSVQLNLKEYLLAYGYSYQGSNQLYKSEKFSQELAARVKRAGHPGKVSALTNYALAEKPYYTGGWLEEFVYAYYKNKLQLNIEQIAFNVKLKRLDSTNVADSDNELDLAYVYQNKLYVIECKVFTAIKSHAQKYPPALYKLGAIQTTLGLHAQCSLVTANSKKDLVDGTIKRLQLLSKALRIVAILDLDEL